jgi:hypothetical protein
VTAVVGAMHGMRPRPGGTPDAMRPPGTHSTTFAIGAGPSTMALMAHQPQPPKHGDIAVTTLPERHAKKHLSEMTKHAAVVQQYNGHGAGPETGLRLPNTGESSQGGFQQGGAGGADYTTTSTGNTGDADSGGPSGW